jgi:hypothetical protein
MSITNDVFCTITLDYIPTHYHKVQINNVHTDIDHTSHSGNLCNRYRTYIAYIRKCHQSDTFDIYSIFVIYHSFLIFYILWLVDSMLCNGFWHLSCTIPNIGISSNYPTVNITQISKLLCANISSADQTKCRTVFFRIKVWNIATTLINILHISENVINLTHLIYIQFSSYITLF